MESEVFFDEVDVFQVETESEGVQTGLTIQDLQPYLESINYHIQLQNTISLFFVALCSGVSVCFVLYRFITKFF